MKATGIVRRIDDLGRLVIPKELRRVYDIQEGDPLEIFTDKDSIIIKKYDTSKKCIFCGEDDTAQLIEHEDAAICKICADKIGVKSRR